VLGNFGVNNTLRTGLVTVRRRNSSHGITATASDRWIGPSSITLRHLSYPGGVRNSGITDAYIRALYRGAELRGAESGWLEQEITREYLQIHDAALEDPYKKCYAPEDESIGACSNQRFEDALTS
jgi:hypothetical protein